MAEAGSLAHYVARARALGAAEAKVIDTASVTTAEWVRMKCRYGCGGYNTTLCCPPLSPTPEETRRMLAGYQAGILIRCSVQDTVKEIVAGLEREAFLDGHYKAFALGAGPCNLCPECSRTRCRHPRQARPAMEACGIDVYATAHANGMPVAVATDRTSEQNYYGLLLVE